MIELTNKNFKEFLLSDKPVMVDFWATWCPPCKALTPILEQISKDMPDIAIGKVNIEEAVDLADRYKVSAIPTLVFFKNGEEVKRLLGLQSEDAIKEQFENMK